MFDNKRCPILSSLSGMPFILVVRIVFCIVRILKQGAESGMPCCSPSAFSLFSLRMPAVFSIYVFF